MTRLLLLSGGLDSTYLFHDMIVNGNECVDVAFIDGGQGKAKVDIEENIVKKMFQKYSKNYPSRVGKFLSPISRPYFGRSALILHQAPSWLFGMLELIDPNRHTSVVIGYVQGDSICSKLSEFEEVWRSLCRTFLEKEIPLEFPLKYLTKEQILHRYVVHDLLSLYNKTWTCEMPKMERKRHVPCGGCVSCRTHRKALFGYRLEYGYDIFHNVDPKKGTRLYREMISHRYDSMEHVPPGPWPQVDLEELKKKNIEYSS